MLELKCAMGWVLFAEAFVCSPRPVITVEENPPPIVVEGERNASRFRLKDLSREEALFAPKPFFPYQLPDERFSFQELATSPAHCSLGNGRPRSDCSFGVVAMTLVFR